MFAYHRWGGVNGLALSSFAVGIFCWCRIHWDGSHDLCEGLCEGTLI